MSIPSPKSNLTFKGGEQAIYLTGKLGYILSITWERPRLGYKNRESQQQHQHFEVLNSIITSPLWTGAMTKVVFY